jgi:hypothetical protein
VKHGDARRECCRDAGSNILRGQRLVVDLTSGVSKWMGAGSMEYFNP